MKKFFTLLALVLFASVNVTFAAATTANTTSTTVVESSTTTSKKDGIKKFFAKAKKDLSQRQLIAAVLAFFLGYLGIHNFYLGRKKQAIWQLVLGILGIVTTIILIGFLILGVVWIWSLVDLIRILTGKLG